MGERAQTSTIILNMRDYLKNIKLKPKDVCKMCLVTAGMWQKNFQWSGEMNSRGSMKCASYGDEQARRNVVPVKDDMPDHV